MTMPAAGPAPAAWRAPERKLVAIASGKGGVGKTWLAITLAHALARSGRRVLVFNADLGLANVDIQLGLVPKSDLQAVLLRKLTLNQAIASYAEGGFDVLAGSSGSGSLASLPAPRLDALAEQIAASAEAYDHVILDLAAGVEGPVRHLCRPVGTCLVVATEEPTSLTDAYAFIKLTARDCPRTDMRIVVNMAPSRRAGERTYGMLVKACQTFLGLAPPLAAVVRRDDKVPDAIRHQAPLLVRHPTSPAAGDVEALAEGVQALQ